MAMSDDDATKRSKLMTKINETIADVDAARKRVCDARSALGTAEAELLKTQRSYADVLASLNALLPSPTLTKRSVREESLRAKLDSREEALDG